MKLEDQVCTLEQAKRLKELGVAQNSYFSWCGDETSRLKDNGNSAEIGPWVFVSTTIPFNNMEADHRADVPSAKPFAAAFTVAELGVMLPDFYPSWRFKHPDDPHKDIWITTIIAGPKPPVQGDIHTAPEFDRFGKTQAEALATILIALLDTEVETAEEINKRLTA